MIISFQHGQQTYSADLDAGVSIARALTFGRADTSGDSGDGPTATPWTSGDFVGSVAAGGSCNVDAVSLVPHVHGTHTETVGHIVDTVDDLEAPAIREVAPLGLLATLLITVHPVAGTQARAAGETYRPPIEGTDQVITAGAIDAAISKADLKNVDAIVIRTSVTGPQFSFASGEATPYLTNEAIESVNATHCRHLLIDLPSIDRLVDDGLLINHRLFWNVADGSTRLSNDSHPEKTITELITVPPELADGLYLLNLQTTAMIADASPSRPVLFPLNA